MGQIIGLDENNNPLSSIIFSESQAASKQSYRIIQQSPKKVRQILLAARQDDKINFKNVNLDLLGYKQHKTANNICRHHICPNTEKYYICQSCSIRNEESYQVIFCQSCFEPEKHFGHQYQNKLTDNKNFYCNCGQVQRIKKQNFCKNHTNYNTLLIYQIAENERAQFIEDFTSLIQLGLAESNRFFLIKIQQYLQKLIQHSIYYIRLTFQLLSQEKKRNNTQDKQAYNDQNTENNFYIFILLRNSYQLSKLIAYLGADLKTRLQLIKLFLQNSQQSILGQNNLNQLLNLTAIKELLQQKYYHKSIFQFVLNNQHIQKCDHLALQGFTELKLNSLRSLKDFEQIKKQQITSQRSLNLLRKFYQFYNRQNRDEELSIKQIEIMSVILAAVLLDNRNKVFRFRNFLIEQIGIDEQKLESLLNSALVNIKKITYDTNQYSIYELNLLIPILLLIKDSNSHKQMVNHFWETMLVIQNSKELVEVSIHKIVDVLYFVICKLCNSDCSLLIQQNKRHSQNQNKFLHTPEDEQTLCNWFRNFLAERQLISREQLSSMRTKGILSFPNVGKILNQVCQYEQGSKCFTYNISKAIDNRFYKFPFTLTKENYPSIYTSKMRLGDEMAIKEGSLAELLIDLVINNERLFEIIQQEWKDSFEKTAIENGEYQYGYLYIFSLVLISNLSKAKNEKLTERIKQIRTSSQLICSYSNTQDQVLKIRYLLGLIPATHSLLSQIKIQQNSSSILKQKNKENLGQYLDLQKVSLLNNDVNDINYQCVLCRKNQVMVDTKFNLYFFKIVKQKSACSAFYGQNNVARTLLKTCFHKVHFDCYLNHLQKNQQSKEIICPVCQLGPGFTFSVNYLNSENKKIKKFCRNQLVYSMASQEYIYDLQSLFMLIFKHLVESKGLNSLIFQLLYHQNKAIRHKTDTYLLQTMKQMFENSTKESQQEYLTEIEEFEKSIYECKRQECKTVQLLFTLALKSILTHKDETEKLKEILTKIREQINHNQFLIVHQQLQKLIQSEIELPIQTEQHISNPKSSLSFSLMRLPEKASQAELLFKGKQCATCEGQQMSYICLLCEKYLCQNCKDQHCSEQHSQYQVNLQVSTLKIHYNNLDESDEQCLYLNYLKEEYYQEQSENSNQSEESGQKLDQQNNQDQYFLEQKRIQKVIQKFMQIQ